MKEKAQLEKTIETLRENSERQVHKFPIKQHILNFVNKSYFRVCTNKMFIIMLNGNIFRTF